MAGNLFNRLTRRFARITFPFFERALNLHVTPNDYYSPIPSVKDLPPDIYDHRIGLSGIDMNEGGQSALLRDVLPLYLAEFTPQPNGGLSLAETQPFLQPGHRLTSFWVERKPTPVES